LVHPLKDDSAKSWVKNFGKIFYFTLLPLIVLLFTAIFTRVLQYGFTEARYYVLLLAVWLLSLVLYFIFIKRASIKFIPISLFSLVLFSLLFPYFNTFSVAKRSQKQELEKILKNYNLLENGKIRFDKKIPADVAGNISDKFQFLSTRFEYDYLGTLLQDKSKKNFADKETWYISGLFTNVTKASVAQEYDNLRLSSRTLYYNVSDYQYAIQGEDLQDGGVKLQNDHFVLKNRMHSKQPIFELKLNSTEKVDFMPLIKNLFEKHQAIGGDIVTDSLSVENDIGNYHVKIIFNNIERYTHEKKVEYSFRDALFLIRKRK